MPPVHLHSPITAKLLRAANAPGRYRALAKLVAHQEGQSGGPVVKFVQDTGVAWLPKALISRTKIEGFETTFLEFVESGMAYFLPFLGGPLLGKTFQGLAGQHAKFDPKLLTMSLAELEARHAGQLDKVIPVKAAVILSTMVGIGLLGESLVNYGKNLMTAHFFHKDKFSDVVNLSNGKMACTADNSPQVQKSRRRIRQVLLASLGLFAGAGALARFGHRLPGGLQSTLREGVRRFDFDFSRGNQYSIGRGLLGGIMVASLFPYLDSARDRYERLETLCRLPVVFLYILFGQELLQQGMQKRLPNLFKSIMKHPEQGKTEILELEALTRKAIQQAARDCGKPNLKVDDLSALPDDVVQKAAQLLQTPLKAKALHVLAPLGVGIGVTGLGLGLMTRALTAYRYQTCNDQSPTGRGSICAPQPSTSTTAANPFGCPSTGGYSYPATMAPKQTAMAHSYPRVPGQPA